MIEIERVLKTLAEKRPIFHSEADFQHALAWEIHQQWDGCEMRLEFKPPHLEEPINVDIWATKGNTKLVIELKYKTIRLSNTIGRESFDLSKQRALDQGRYDFLKDIQRLEQVVSVHNDISAYAILLTNDDLYWRTAPYKKPTLDNEFRIHEEKTITGELRWALQTSKGTKRGREEPIQIKGTYKLSWKDYSEPSQKKYGKFRYLLVKV